MMKRDGMLVKFEVKNFRNFDDWFCFDLSKSKTYDFNEAAIVDGIINSAIIYGVNGCGKSNLGIALLDLTSHLNDTYQDLFLSENYLNANAKDQLIEFKYTFKFNDLEIQYHYGKEKFNLTLFESLSINGNVCIAIDRRENDIAQYNLKGIEGLKTDLSSTDISVVKYVANNAVLDDNPVNNAFTAFIQFTQSMVLLRSVKGHANFGQQTVGFSVGLQKVSEKILALDLLEDFEQFLNDAGVECRLQEMVFGDTPAIGFKFDNRVIEFTRVASTGTSSLAEFYYWWIQLRESELRLAFIDEFDAFYHHKLSKLIVKKLTEIDCQTILTTHNTSIMTNDLLRPDCYFVFDGVLKQYNELTQKELRRTHNLEKMYRAFK
jgi:AAA15 family ATPase/GTPase